MPGDIGYSDLQAISLTREEIEKRAIMSPQEFRQMVRNRRWKPRRRAEPGRRLGAAGSRPRPPEGRGDAREETAMKGEK